ncbi:MAG: hypothetical protein WAO76_18025 [Georgfuchsia sp.]
MPSMEIASVRIAKKLTPSQAGAKRLAAQYGKDMVCVRYRIDDARGKRYTTVELVVDAQPIATIATMAANALVGVRIAYGETALRNKVKAAGGTWDPAARLWRLEKYKVRTLGLSQRIVRDQA